MSTTTQASDPATELRSRIGDRLTRARALLRISEGLPTSSHEVLDRHNELSLELATAGAECGLLAEVHPDQTVRAAAEELLQELVRFSTELDQHQGIYEALGAIDPAALDAQAARTLELTRRDMRRSGIALGEAERARVTALRDELTLIGQEFARNIRDDVRTVALTPSELAGLPDDYVRAHPVGPDGRVRITTDYPDYIPFLAYATSDRARRELARAFATRAVPRNLELLDRMLAKRHELANVLGYATWADYATEILMTGSAAAVRAFLERAYDATREAGRAERAQLLAMKRTLGLPGAEVGQHEQGYLTQRVKAETLHFDARTVRPYFEYRAVRQAILELSSELFSLSFTPVDVALWHASVETFDVAVDGRPAGRISLDMHPRDGKYKHAACFTYRPGVGGKQLPHYVLVCNFPDPAAASGPALMEHSEVVTFFHEFGHLVHSIVRGGIPWVRLGDVSEWDFVEAPSQFLEEWIHDAGVLRGFARHVESGEAIPEELVARLRAARDFGRGLFTQRQLFFSALALAYHATEPSGLDTTAVLFDLAARYSPSTLDPEDRMQASFGHLEGYGAAYYTYMWSLAHAKAMLGTFQHGLMDLPQARRYRDIVLAQGGAKPAKVIVEEFLGGPFTFDAFEEWLRPDR